MLTSYIDLSFCLEGLINVKALDLFSGVHIDIASFSNDTNNFNELSCDNIPKPALLTYLVSVLNA